MNSEILLMGIIDGFGITVLVLAIVGLITIVRYLIKGIVYLLKKDKD
jgi:hypothetical protein